MRAVVYEHFSQRPVIHELPDPVASDNDVVIAVEATGVCRSDHHAWSGHDDTIVLPHVPGHELVGRIVDKGLGVKNYEIGARVTAPFVCGCGTCALCLSGNAQVCPDQTQPGFTHFGSWAEKVLIHHADANLVAVPEDVPAAGLVGLGCRFATAFHGLRVRAKLQTGESVAVFGCGGVGLSTIMIAHALGASITAIDINPVALEQARAYGAARLVNAAGLTPSQLADEVRAGGNGVSVTVDALGREDTVSAAIASLAPLGRHVQIGLLQSPPVIDLPRVIALELHVLGSHGMAAPEYPELLELVASGALAPQALVSRTIELEDAPEAMIAFDDPARAEPGMTIIEL